MLRVISFTLGLLFLISGIGFAWADNVAQGINNAYQFLAGQQVVQSKMSELARKAKSGDVRAQVKLGATYGEVEEYSSAAYWLKKAAIQGDANAMALLGIIYLKQQVSGHSQKEGFQLVKHSAYLGSALGQNALGVCYMGGIGVKRNYPKAAAWFQKSAAQGFSGGFFNLGQIYFYGHLGEPNRKKGLHLIKLAAMKGAAAAQFKLGSIYGSGFHEIKQNVPYSYMWFVLSALNGSAKGEHSIRFLQQTITSYPFCFALGKKNVAFFYEQGQAGLPQSNEQALAWLKKADQLSPKLAQVQLPLAQLYQKMGSPEWAYHHAVTAAQQPFGNAQQYLASLYKDGVGTDKDLVKASAWYQMALYTYHHPDTHFYSQFVAPCRPKLVTTKQLNPTSAQTALEQIQSQLSSDQKQRAHQLFLKLKAAQEALSKSVKPVQS